MDIVERVTTIGLGPVLAVLVAGFVFNKVRVARRQRRLARKYLSYRLDSLDPDAVSAAGSLLTGVASLTTSVTALVLALREKDSSGKKANDEVDPPHDELSSERDGYL